MDIVFVIIVYKNLGYSSRRTNNIISSIHERLLYKTFVIFFVIVDRGLWLSSRRTKSFGHN